MPKQEEEEEEITEEELIRRIIEYKKFKEISKILKENYLIFPMQNMVMLCKVDSLVVNVIFHTSSKLYANVTSSKKCQVIKN